MRRILDTPTTNGIPIPIFGNEIKVRLANVFGIQLMGQRVRLNSHLRECSPVALIQRGRRINL
jgi:hypothetical protein